MKVFAVLLLVGSVACSPRYTESYEDSDSFGSFELPLADDDNWQKRVLDGMNELRQQGDKDKVLSPLKLDAELSKFAQLEADKRCRQGVDSNDQGSINGQDFALVYRAQDERQGDWKSIMVLKKVHDWYNTVQMSYPHKEDSRNMMRKRFKTVAFGLAMCPGRSLGWLVARYGYGLKAQGLSHEEGDSHEKN